MTGGPPGERDSERERAHAVVTGWRRLDRLDAVRTRVGLLALAGVVLFFGRAFVSVDGLTRLLVQAWVVLSLPVTVLSASIYLTLRGLESPDDLLEDDETVTAVTVLVLASLDSAREQYTAGRVVWRLLLNHPPESPGYTPEADPTVERAVHYVHYAMVGSLALVVVEQTWVRAARVGSASLSAVEWTGFTAVEAVALVGSAVLVGAVIGVVLAVSRG